MLVLAYLGSQCTQFEAARWACWIFTFIYLESCIWPDAISRWTRQRNSIKYWANLGISVADSLAIIRQAFREEGMSHTRGIELYARFRAHLRRRDRWRAKSRASSLFFLTSRDLFFTKKKFNLADQTVTFYGDWMEISPELCQQKRTYCCNTKTRLFTYSFFARELFTKTRKDWRPPPDLFFCVSSIEDKVERLKGCHFDTVEVIEQNHRTRLPGCI
jgi:hypothetical protein